MSRRWLLRSFQSFYRFDRWLGQRLTAAGRLVLAAMVAAMVLGINTRLNLASQIFALLACVLLAGALASLRFRPPLQVCRTLPPLATAGQPVRYAVRVENRGSTPQRGLFLSDECRNAFPSYEEYLHRRDPEDRYRNRFDRYVGYPRWQWLTRQKCGTAEVRCALPPIPPRQSVEVDLEFIPGRRGLVHLQGYRIACPDPLGVVNAVHRIDDPAAVLVLPRRYPVAPLYMPGGRLYQPGGIALAASSGDSEEFFALRDYRPGDSLRTVHWKSWARAGRPVVRETRAEYFARHALILDTFAEAGDEEIFEEAVAVAASLVAADHSQDVLLDLLFVGPQAYRFTSGRGLDSRTQLLKILACVEPVRGRAFAELSGAVLRHAGQFSGCLAVLLGWDEARGALVQGLRSRGIFTLALVITDRVEPEGDYVALPMGRIAEVLSTL